MRTTFRTILSKSGLIAALGVVTLPPFAPGLVAQETTVLADTIPTDPEGETVVEEDRAEDGVEAGYEKNGWNGFLIRSKDGQFRLNIGAYPRSVTT